MADVNAEQANTHTHNTARIANLITQFTWIGKENLKNNNNKKWK